MLHLLHADAPVLGHERQRGHELAKPNSPRALRHQVAALSALEYAFAAHELHLAPFCACSSACSRAP